MKVNWGYVVSAGILILILVVIVLSVVIYESQLKNGVKGSECIKDTDCAPGYVCFNGNCDNSCGNNSQCSGTNICYLSHCTPKQCTTNTDCEPNEACVKYGPSLDVIGNQVQYSYCTPSGFAPVWPNGATGCKSNSDCFNVTVGSSTQSVLLCGATGTCVQCQGDQDCNLGIGQHCDVPRGICTFSCAGNGDCSSGTQYCRPGPNAGFCCPTNNGIPTNLNCTGASSVCTGTAPFCVNGTCSCMAGNYFDVCNVDSDCSSGACLEGVCAQGAPPPGVTGCLYNYGTGKKLSCPSQDAPYCVNGVCSISKLGMYCGVNTNICIKEAVNGNPAANGPCQAVDCTSAGLTGITGYTFCKQYVDPSAYSCVNSLCIPGPGLYGAFCDISNSCSGGLVCAPPV